MFVKQQDVQAVETMVDNYKSLRALTLELALATLDSVRQSGMAQTLQMYIRDAESASGAGAGWKDKCRKRARQLKAAAVRIRDLLNSRHKWRRECLELRKKTKSAPDAPNSQTTEAGEKK
jgi:hypothetical protein